MFAEQRKAISRVNFVNQRYGEDSVDFCGKRFHSEKIG